MHIVRAVHSLYRNRALRYLSSGKGNNGQITKRPREDVSLSENEDLLGPLHTQKPGLFIQPGILFQDYPNKNYLIAKIYLFSLIFLITSFSAIKIVPPGYVGIIVRRNGEMDQFNNEGRMALFRIPFMDKPVAFRITPIRKKIVRKCLTSDSKTVEVVIFLTFTAKLAFATHIYSIYGTNYTKGFVEKELCFDIDQVVKKYNLDDLVAGVDIVEEMYSTNSDIHATVTHSSMESANEEIIERFQDAGAFNKIIVSDVNISYRNPDILDVAE
ncbi:prohibitin-like protein, putative [Theileria equi strain WA]|uniref:Prohibitin-like protein, putative n=1 Tax=Theileria equi strain WA TaxID=1537102 RepID=L0B0H8_THEEQ|nr:prohibitin-like protein, putative [Theileria equi strain WA]AFZ81357.1 prohibitin-like protein, putative [Theileria equi strain WA]|eukprot:XP_004831023.1 prohibitin-like protein, putative [Theileria equi strain WA]